MAIRNVILEGFGPGATIAFVIREGFGSGAAAAVNLDGITSGDGGLGISCATGIVHRRAEVDTYHIQKIPYATP